MKQVHPMSASFEPIPERAQDFRAALGRFGTGVTVVTCNCDIGPLGMTANSFASVSLDPPLVLWSPGRQSARFEAFSNASHFAIHVLGSEQAHIGLAFAREGQPFDGLAWETSDKGVPILKNCLSLFECAKHAQHDGGDHEIIIGRVERVNTRPGQPLIFCEGSFGGFEPVKP